MKFALPIIALSLLVSSCSNKPATEAPKAAPSWEIDFFDDFNTFNSDNWQDQILWVNNEDQCYVPNNEYGTREVSNGTIKIKVVDIGEKRPCTNTDKTGKQHHDTQYVAGRIATKNLQEFVKGKWTARLRVVGNSKSGMFPAWWLLGAMNDEPPVQEENENVCWPMTGSGEIDIFEHHSDGGPDHYAARSIKNLGHCDGGDWQALMLVLETSIDEYHDYSVEWSGIDLIFRLDGKEVYRNNNETDQFPEPLFAILNFAKINDSAMTGTWVMEVDWVKHERLKEQP